MDHHDLILRKYKGYILIDSSAEFFNGKKTETLVIFKKQRRFEGISKITIRVYGNHEEGESKDKNMPFDIHLFGAARGIIVPQKYAMRIIDSLEG